MTLKIGDTAPDFQAHTTEGPIRFHDWIGDSWAVLFSHPKDFTPVCTTELGYLAKIRLEFDNRNVKIIGLSVDFDRRSREVGQGHRGDAGGGAQLSDHRRRRLRGVGALRDAARRDLRRGHVAPPADNQTVRNVFVIGPDKQVKLILVYPMTTGRNFDEVLRVIDSLQLTSRHKVATPVNWRQDEDVIISGSVSDEEARELFGEWEAPRPYIRIVPQPGRGGSCAVTTPELERIDRRRAMKKHVVIVGAGFAGLELAARLSDSLADEVDVTLLDRNDAFYFGFSKLDVLLGRRAPSDVLLHYRDIAKEGVEFRQETVTAIDPLKRRVYTEDGRYDADYLAVALGAEYDMAATPGFREGGFEYYSLAGAERLSEALAEFASRGRF